jgi:hypothetical protein
MAHVEVSSTSSKSVEEIYKLLTDGRTWQNWSKIKKFGSSDNSVGSWVKI